MVHQVYQVEWEKKVNQVFQDQAFQDPPDLLALVANVDFQVYLVQPVNMDCQVSKEKLVSQVLADFQAYLV